MLETVGGRGNDLHALHHQGRAVLQQHRVEAFGNVGDLLRRVRKRNASEAEVCAVVRVD